MAVKGKIELILSNSCKRISSCVPFKNANQFSYRYTAPQRAPFDKQAFEWRALLKASDIYTLHLLWDRRRDFFMVREDSLIVRGEGNKGEIVRNVIHPKILVPSGDSEYGYNVSVIAPYMYVIM
ncbi:unnamed protein product [Allacma fusca]|uniref:Uncharacterized protein n=1 Tax=Allacma fusca TaxID=39272 RepID=A0A8J2JL77_9HEXA|nr:unnamed protein product [Allacma fusca]